MLDKDIDKLFQERFEAFETVPANLVWDKISVELSEDKSKRRINPTIWKAAASFLIFLSAALWFYRPQEVIKLHGSSDETVQRIGNPEPIIATTKSAAKVSQVVVTPVKIIPPNKQKLGIPAHLKHGEVFLSSQKVESAVKSSTSNRPITVDMIEPVQIETIYASSPENVPNIAMNTKLDFVESQLIESDSPKIKIKSIGSLVNFVIAKVDHREDKIIEFADSDEGSEVSGINLGVLKFKSKTKH